MTVEGKIMQSKPNFRNSTIATKRSSSSIMGTALLPLLILQILGNFQTTHGMGIGAYIYYEGAECVKKDSMIHGTFIYAYDNSRMSGKGFVKQNYYGPCKYFEGGFYDFMYASDSGKSYMKTGYCAECHGMVGCTKTPYNCTEFQSLVPSKAYTLSSSSSFEDNGDSFNTNSNYEAMEQVAEQVEYGVYQEISAASLSYDGSVFVFALLGMFSGLTALMVIYVGMTGIKRIRKSKASIDTTEFLDERCDDGNDDSVDDIRMNQGRDIVLI